MKSKKRFIAGAKCPQCNSMDTLMLYLHNNVEVVECVDCGHKQQQTDGNVEKAAGTADQVIGIFKPE